MNGFENIIAKINAECSAEVAAITAEADARCESIRAEGEKKAKDEYAVRIAKGASDASVLIEHRKSITVLEGKKIILAEKQKMISRAFDRAEELLAELPEDEYTAFLAKLADGGAVTGTEELVLSGADRARYGKNVCIAANNRLKARGLPGSLTLSRRTADIKGGLILVLGGGNIEVNCSIEALVKGTRHDMTQKVASVLFD